MNVSPLQILVQVTLVSSTAVLLVGALRRPLRCVVGARAAYWLWIAVPATALAVLLPVPLHRVDALANALRPSLGSGFSGAVIRASPTGASWDFADAVLSMWIVGIFLLASWLVVRQRSFVRSLGHLAADADGIYRSDRITAPMLVGAWRARVVVPRDFEERYPAHDRLLMLAHERAHQERGDALANSMAAVWLCLFWFNPFMHWALERFRFDQELACDALVLARSDAGRKRYADALLRAQMSSETSWRVPVGCNWQSTHPLKERIAMLKLPHSSFPRRMAGIAFAVVLTAGMYTVSSSFAQAPAQAEERKISIDADDMETRKVLELIARKGEHNILVSDQVSGKITVHLKDVTWRAALDIVVQSQGLATRQSGNITFVDVAR